MTETLASEGLERTIGHVFRDPSLLEQALRHRSMEGRDNERLEFLGDGLLNALIGVALYRARPRDNEGALSRLRASLVRESTLAELARELGLGAHLELGESERKTGGHRRDSILSDALEAILGAIYLDAGFAAAEAACSRWFATRLAALPDPESLKDPKTRLQEWLQARSLELPVYRVLRETGPAHRRHFEVRCELADANLHTEAQGISRRSAEQQAAEQMLARLTGVAHG